MSVRPRRETCDWGAQFGTTQAAQYHHAGHRPATGPSQHRASAVRDAGGSAAGGFRLPVSLRRSGLTIRGRGRRENATSGCRSPTHRAHEYTSRREWVGSLRSGKTGVRAGAQSHCVPVSAALEQRGTLRDGGRAAVGGAEGFRRAHRRAPHRAQLQRGGVRIPASIERARGARRPSGAAVWRARARLPRFARVAGGGDAPGEAAGLGPDGERHRPRYQQCPRAGRILCRIASRRGHGSGAIPGIPRDHPACDRGRRAKRSHA